MKQPEKGPHSVPLALATAVLVLACFTGCRPSIEDFRAVQYAPAVEREWQLSTPEAQGLDPMLVAALYYHAAKLKTIHGLLVVRNGRLVAERYFNGATIDEKARLQSVTKSITSALVGIALEQGCLSSVDQKMVDFFPELTTRISDPRKNRITIEQMLQMRAGYPWEESSKKLFDVLYGGFRPAYLVDVPLARNPGTDFEYSNLTSHLLGIILARACDTDLRSYAQEHLFEPLGAEMGLWIKDWEGYYNGHADLHLTARDMAKFGLLYLNDGEYAGTQVVQADWVKRSLQTYSEDAWDYPVGKNFTNMGYGYQWWSATAGDHRFNFAWGHGGQLIVLLKEFDMVVVVTADPLVGQHGGGPWGHEKANMSLVGDFIASLPG